MKTFEELKAFIELKAAEYEAVDEGETYENLWECELVEIQVLKEVASLALHEGTILENIDLSFYVENLSKTPDPDEVDEDEWSDMWTCLENDVRDALSELADKKQLPAKTQILHDFWQRSFYPKFYGEDD
ncbi:MAG: hypothetical protein WCJ11_00835 [Methylococcaceae bacterium]